MRDRVDSTPLLSTLEGVPALVIVGQEDQITPPDRARAMADALPPARFVSIPGAGHLSPLEQPAAVTEALASFLRSLP
jgi:pimeloyl-ACP methyl ester carboxylesterase